MPLLQGYYSWGEESIPSEVRDAIDNGALSDKLLLADAPALSVM